MIVVADTNEAGHVTLTAGTQTTTQQCSTIADARDWIIDQARGVARTTNTPVDLHTTGAQGEHWFRVDPAGALVPTNSPAAAPVSPIAPPTPTVVPLPTTNGHTQLYDAYAPPAAAAPPVTQPTPLPSMSPAPPPAQAEWAASPVTNPPAARPADAVMVPDQAPRRAKPTLDDLLESRPAPKQAPAEWGWRRFLRLAPGPAELRHRTSIASIQRSLAGPRTVVVVNPKGGACKTTATMLLAATFGIWRGGFTLAWDNNETRGTLGWRAIPARHTNTAVDLLHDLDRFQDARSARVGDLDNYVRNQGSAQFDVLASDEDPAASDLINAEAFSRLHATLARFYRVLVIDTGNNMRADNWLAAINAADQLVIVSTVREDTAQSAAWLIDGLRAKGHDDKVDHAVTILSAPAKQPDPALMQRLHHHFGQLTRTVVDVPHDPALVDGGPINVDRLHPDTREAWIHATAAVADGL